MTQTQVESILKKIERQYQDIDEESANTAFKVLFLSPGQDKRRIIYFRKIPQGIPVGWLQICPKPTHSGASQRNPKPHVPSGERTQIQNLTIIRKQVFTSLIYHQRRQFDI